MRRKIHARRDGKEGMEWMWEGGIWMDEEEVTEGSDQGEGEKGGRTKESGSEGMRKCGMGGRKAWREGSERLGRCG